MAGGAARPPTPDPPYQPTLLAILPSGQYPPGRNEETERVEVAACRHAGALGPRRAAARPKRTPVNGLPRRRALFLVAGVGVFEGGVVE
jgi:hypothetical protein